ncbi:MAG: TonB-dependent receptor [Pseudomonadota bacterium]
MKNISRQTHKISSLNKILLTSLFLGSTALTPVVYAQTDDSADEQETEEASNNRVLNTVTVTANRREQSLQDVGLSVLALGEAELEKKGIDDLAAIELNSPSFNIEQNALKTRPAIRGFGGDPLAPGQEFLSGMFLDGIYQSSGSLASVEAVDLQRVEVLRGPQGTLWGKNVVGGAVNLVPNKPGDEFEASAKVTLGNFGRVDLEGMANFVTGPVKHRLVGYTRDNDGAAFNENLGVRAHDIGRTGFRYSAAADLTDQLSWDFTFDGVTDDQAGRAVIIRGDTRDASNGPDEATIFDYLAFTTGQNTEGSNDYTIFNDNNGFATREVFGFRNEFNWANDSFGVTFLSAYRNYEDAFFEEGRQFSNQQVADAMEFLIEPDASIRGPFDQLQPNGGAAVTSAVAGAPPGFLDLGDDAEGDQWSHELRVSNAGISDDRLTWTVGAFTSRESGENAFLLGISSFSIIADGDPCGGELITASGGTPVCLVPLDLIRSADNVTTDFAIFSDVTYAVTDRLNVTGGVRWTTNSKDFTQNNFVNGNPAGTGSNDITNEDVTWRVLADYKLTDDILIYASAATGFAPAGFLSVPTGNPALLGVPDSNVTSQSFEAGWKADLFNDNTRLNVNFFSSDFEGLGSSQVNGAGEGIAVTADDVKVRGVEVEWDQQYFAGLSSSVRYTYLKSEVFGLEGLLAGFEDGNPLQRAPENDISGTLQYQRDFSDGSTMDLAVIGSYRSEVFDDPNANADEARPERTLFDAYASFTTADDKYTIKVWGKNLLDEAYPVALADFRLGLQQILGDPRTYGVTLSTRF